MVTSPEQLAARHCETGYAHAVMSLPSQAPPHVVPSEAQAVRDPCGAPTTGVHAPAFPGTSQAWHSPSQAALQQTPSTQKLDPHWFAPPQAAPSVSLGAQTPPEQKLPALQSESTEQSPRQAVAPHK